MILTSTFKTKYLNITREGKKDLNDLHSKLNTQILQDRKKRAQNIICWYLPNTFFFP